MCKRILSGELASKDRVILTKKSAQTFVQCIVVLPIGDQFVRFPCGDLQNRDPVGDHRAACPGKRSGADVPRIWCGRGSVCPRAGPQHFRART